MGNRIPNRKAGLYIYLMILTGAVFFSLALWQAHLTDFRFLIFAVLTGLSSLFPIYIPTGKGKNRGVVVTIGSIFIFTAILVFGPAEAAVLAFIEAAVSGGRSHDSFKSRIKIWFNLLHLPLVTYFAGQFFYLLFGASPPLNPINPPDISWMLVVLTLTSLVYFVLNSGAVAVAISLWTGSSLRRIWSNGFLTSLLSNLAETACAVVVFLNLRQTIPLAIGIALPIAFVIYYAYKMNLGRIGEAERHLDQINDLYHSTIEALAMAVDAKDQLTHGHIYRVQAMVLGLARNCGISDEKELAGLRAAALLHDIGKLATPDYILNKPGTLTDSEMETMKTHASLGADILSTVPFPYPVIPFVRYHHEKWDGSGYPEGLTGDAIPLGARILAIVDCYDALRSDRPYRSKLSRQAALDYIKSESGKSYDPMVVEQLISGIDELEARASRVAPPAGTSSLYAPATQLGDSHDTSFSNTVFHDIASAHREVQAIHEISRAVGRLLNVSETLALLAKKLQQLIRFDACAIFLVDSDSRLLKPHHASGLGSDFLNALRLQVGEGVAGWVAANRRALLNVSPNPDFKSHPGLKERLNSCLAVPLVLDNDVVGVISLYGSASQSFRPNHLRLLESISQHAATAISNAVIFEETQDDAYTDILTGMPNLRYFQIFVKQELQRAERAHYPVTLIMMDLDNFKQINDKLGHKTGDRVLIEIAHVLRNQLRKSDTCIRYGGDEFIGVLPGVDATTAVMIMDKIQSAVDEHVIQLDESRSIRPGISIGAATFPHDGLQLDRLLMEADRKMYRNKISRHRHSASIILPFDRHSESA